MRQWVAMIMLNIYGYITEYSDKKEYREAYSAYHCFMT